MLLFLLHPQMEEEEDGMLMPLCPPCGGRVQAVPSPSTGAGREVMMILCWSGGRSLMPREPFL